MKCPQCGMEIPSDANVCPFCHFNVYNYYHAPYQAGDHSLSWGLSGLALGVGAFWGWIAGKWTPFWIGLGVAVVLFLLIRLLYEHD